MKKDLKIIMKQIKRYVLTECPFCGKKLKSVNGLLRHQDFCEEACFVRKMKRVYVNDKILEFLQKKKEDPYFFNDYFISATSYFPSYIKYAEPWELGMMFGIRYILKNKRKEQNEKTK